MNARSALTSALPPAVADLLRGRFGAIRFRGDYPTWEAALRECGGYDDGDILERVTRASLAVKEGRSAYERDSVLFDRIEYSWPVLAGLLWAALRRDLPQVSRVARGNG